MINLTPNNNIEKLIAYEKQATIYWNESTSGKLKRNGKITISKVSFWNEHLRKEFSPNSTGLSVVICIARNKEKERYSFYSVGKQEVEEEKVKDCRYIPLTWIIKAICQEPESDWINPRNLLKKIADCYFETPQMEFPLDNLPIKIGKEVIKLTTEEAFLEDNSIINFKECIKRLGNSSYKD